MQSAKHVFYVVSFQILVFLAIGIYLAHAQTAQNYAVVNSQGQVVNLIVWDGLSNYAVPNGDIAVPAANGAQIGGTYSNGTFTPPVGADSVPVQ